MADSVSKQVRKKIGENLKALIEQRGESSLRDIDAKTSKDHSWLGRIFRGEQNITIDSLCNLMQEFNIQPKDLFNFTVKFTKEGDS